jgi:NADH-quinone oxidoreductase subunit M
MNLLDIILLLPLAGFALTLLIPKSQGTVIRGFALVVSLLTFAGALSLATHYHPGPSPMFVTDIVWVQSPEIHYHVIADGIGLWMIVLSAFLTPLAILASWTSIVKRAKEYFALILLLEFGLIGVFAAYDLFLYYVFWEVSIVPFLFLIGIWGGQRRAYASLKFFVYTMAGSVLMLAGMIYIYTRAKTFDVSEILNQLAGGRLTFSHTEQMLLFLGFFAAFAIKGPVFPFHTWLPDFHEQAPAPVSMLLLKLGVFGMLRFCLPLFPGAARDNAPWIVVLAIIGIIYGALLALGETNILRLIAYSSVSHVGFMVLGIFTFTQLGTDGAVYQLINHGISTGGLFLITGLLIQRRKSTQIADFGGVAHVAPWLATAYLITTLAGIGLPTLNSFVGEYLVLQGAAQANFRYAVFAAIGVILSACYMLWLYQRLFYGDKPDRRYADLDAREWLCIVPLIVMMFWLGIGTQTFLPAITGATAHILEDGKQNVPFRVEVTPAAPPLEAHRAN